MQEMFNRGISGLAQQGIAGETAAQAEANKILEGISQRKLDLQMQKFDIAQARAAQRKAAANRNLGLFLGKALDGAENNALKSLYGDKTKAAMSGSKVGGQPEPSTAPTSKTISQTEVGQDVYDSLSGGGSITDAMGTFGIGGM